MIADFRRLVAAHEKLSEVCCKFESMCCEAHLHHTATEYATAIAFAATNIRYLTDAVDPYERQVAINIGRNSIKIYEDALQIIPDTTIECQELKIEYETALESIKEELIKP